MSLFSTILLAVGVAMDCLAVSICIGTIDQERDIKLYLNIALHFGLFQAGMALIGWLLGSNLLHLIQSFDHWIAFILLCYVGIKMIIEGANADMECPIKPSNEKTVLMLSLATSIDALAVGVSLGAIADLNVGLNIFLIGLTSFLFSIAGSFFGRKLGNLLDSRMEIVGGAILFLLGSRLLFEHLTTGI
jgi:putative Mn2+ efflux pump MntP